MLDGKGKKAKIDGNVIKIKRKAEGKKDRFGTRPRSKSTHEEIQEARKMERQ